jgi:UDP-glucose 4-epimerase
VVFAGSAAIFGNEPSVPKTEASPPAPASPYGLHKLEGEWYLALYSALFGLSTVSLRYFNIYGPRQDPHSPYSGVISIFADRLLRGEQPEIHGDGQQTRDFVYVADVAEVNRRALTAPLPGHHRFNVGAGRETTIRQLYDQLAALTGQPNAPSWAPARPGDVRRSYADPRAAEAQLGFRARYTLQEGLTALLRWLRDS